MFNCFSEVWRCTGTVDSDTVASETEVTDTKANNSETANNEIDYEKILIENMEKLTDTTYSSGDPPVLA